MVAVEAAAAVHSVTSHVWAGVVQNVQIRSGGELGAASSATATSTVVSSAALADRSTDTISTISSTKTIHSQQPDGTWAMSVVPCGPREIVVPLPSLPAATLHDSVMQSDLKVAGLLDNA